MVNAKLQKFRWYQHILKLKDFSPAIAFFAGFIWDALTIGRSVKATDLWILSAYLIATIPIIWWLAKKESLASVTLTSNEGAPLPSSPSVKDMHWETRMPYMALQFLFGSLFSALFILYFKSSSHLTAIVWSIGMGALLVANEFLERSYKRFTLSWTLFGLCAILLLNFVLPFMVGSVHAIWFFISILIAVTVTQHLKLRISSQIGSIKPTYIVAAIIALAYVLDVIPPVPLVKRDIQVGTQFEIVADKYRILQDKAPWWIFWRDNLNAVHINTGDQVYCVSAIFAPSGIKTRLYHNWQRYDAGKGWLTESRIGFNLAGGRDNGFRGYTFKKNIAFGEWRVKIETENGRTIAVHDFEIKKNGENQLKLPKAI
jgi:hypothetical protein